jgi:hypothetical protein
MRTLLGIAITLTALILAYTLRKPTLNWAFNHHTDQPPTPDGWTPKMRTYKNGVIVLHQNLEAVEAQLSMGLAGGPLTNPNAFASNG